jgi:hypothetical protein
VHLSLFKPTLIFSILLSFQTSYADIWPTQNRWDQPVQVSCSKWPQAYKADCEEFFNRNLKQNTKWSDLYSAWVRDFWHKEIYLNPSSPLKGIATDCADASYGMRVYFSWLFNLEFKIKYPGASGRFITNSDNNFNQIAQPEARLKAFLKWLGGLVSTRSLPDDTFPIALEEKFFRPGILFNTKTHTNQMVDVDVYGVGKFLYSTVPLRVRELKELFDYPSSIPSDFSQFSDGFRAFLEPQDYAKPMKEIPGYSLEQFNLTGISQKGEESKNQISSAQIGQFYDKLQERFQREPEPVGRKVTRFLQSVCSQVRERMVLIQDTLAINEGKCISSKSTYDEFSTPSRDRELKNLFEKGRYLYQMLQNTELRQQALRSSDVSTALKEYEVFVLDTIFRNPGLELNVSQDWSDNYCQLEPLIRNPDQRKLTLRRVWQKILTNALVSDPNAGFYQRWGMEPYEAKCSEPKN